MDNVIFENDKIIIKNATNFDLEQTLDCGQAFRWQKDENNVWSGIAFGKYIELYKNNNDVVILNSNKEDFYSVWTDYFDLKRDYNAIIKEVSVDKTVEKAAKYGSGIRILNQDGWEALCSFIISQNNNIPRIKGIIERLCQNFGTEINGGYTFPSAETVSKLTVEDLSPLRCGFRAKYIIDAARKVADGTVNLKLLKNQNYIDARQTLMNIKGVGPKVADCVLLYGLGHVEAFPRDVWINRALEQLFDGKIPPCADKYGGIVQQYIFYYIRNNQL